MSFNTLSFVLFFPLFFIVYWTARNRLRAQNAVVLAGSWLFYGWWDWRYLGLLLGVSLTTYVTARLTERGHRRAWTAANIAVCLTTLCVFKYFGFFSENLQRLFAVLGWELDWFTIEVLLPVGISFYTFQAIGYSVDVYRRQVAVERDPVVFASFLAYFPQLVAGPIERASSLMPQLAAKRRWSYPMAVDGAREALWGMFKKVVVADACAPYTSEVFGRVEFFAAEQPSALTVAVILFMIQIYGDFSGYCDIARGVSRCLGIEIMQNFHYPLFSHSVRDRWQRWNVSLMHWFRNYVYFPLGGSRCATWRTCLNVMIVFVISGLWHGAAWTFVLWGVYWGVLSVMARFMPRERASFWSPSNGIPSMLALTAASYMIFRAQTLGDIPPMVVPVSLSLAVLALAGETVVLAWRHSPRIVTIVAGAVVAAGAAVGLWWLGDDGVDLMARWTLIVPTLAMLAVEWHNRSLTHGLERMPRLEWVRIACYVALLLMILTSHSEDINFIYYQF